MSSLLATTLVAVLCTSLQQTFFCLAVFSVLTLVAIPLQNTCRKWEISPVIVPLLTVALGQSILLFCKPLFGLTLQTDLALPLFLVCGLLGTQTLPSKSLLITSGVLVLVGGIRELLSTSSLFSYPLFVAPVQETFGITSTEQVGIGGILVAAIILAIFSVSQPLPSAHHVSAKGVLIFSAAAVVILGADGAVAVYLPALPIMWRFFAGVVLGTVALLLFENDITPFFGWLPAVFLLWMPQRTIVESLFWGLFIGALPLLFAPLADRLYRVKLPRRFAGAPLILTLSAVTACAVQAI